MDVNFKKFSLKFKKIDSCSDENDFGPICIAGFILILALSFGPQFIQLVKADTNSVRFTATVGTSLSFTIDATSKAFGTVAVGTPKFATSTLYIVTNNSTGSNTTISRASTTYTLFTGDETIPDTPNGNNWTAPAATGTTPVGSAAWVIGTTKGLGFRVISAATDIGSGASTTCGAATAWWGTDDGGANAKWSGISTSTAAQQIANCGYYKANASQTVVYQIDVSATQAGGSYQSSPITFSVTANP